MNFTPGKDRYKELIVKATPENLDQEIVEQLKDWANGDLRRAVNEAVKETAETAQNVAAGRPVPGKNGRLYQDWDSKLRKGKYTSEIMTDNTVYTKALPFDPLTGKGAPKPERRQS